MSSLSLMSLVFSGKTEESNDQEPGDLPRLLHQNLRGKERCTRFSDELNVASGTLVPKNPDHEVRVFYVDAALKLNRLRGVKVKIRRSIFGYSVGVVALHVFGIALLVSAILHHPTLLGLGFLAYTFGLRHAFDADHIAAIDNTVRKLRQEDKDPVGVGFFFSLGHSTIVIIMAVVTAFAVQWAQRSIPELQNIGGIVGTLVSAVFLFAIGFINLFVLMNLYQVFKKMRTDSLNEDQFEELLNSRGFLARMIGPVFKFVNKSWHIYPIGVLFGFSFDTASEVALLAISAGAAKNAIPFTGILALPILFSAGMSLMDTADGVFMTTAYNWAFATPWLTRLGYAMHSMQTTSPPLTILYAN